MGPNRAVGQSAAPISLLFYEYAEGARLLGRTATWVCEEPSVALVGLEHRGLDGFDGRADPELHQPSSDLERLADRSDAQPVDRGQARFDALVVSDRRGIGKHHE